MTVVEGYEFAHQSYLQRTSHLDPGQGRWPALRRREVHGRSDYDREHGTDELVLLRTW